MEAGESFPHPRLPTKLKHVVPSSEISELTCLQQFALDEFIESPSDERWQILVRSLRRRRRRRKHGPSTMGGVEDLAQSSENAPLLPVTIVASSIDDSTNDEPLEKNSFLSEETSPPLAELVDEEAEEMSLAAGSEDDFSHIHSDIIGGNCRGDSHVGAATGNNDVFVSGAFLARDKLYHKSARKTGTTYEGVLARPWYKGKRVLMAVILVLFEFIIIVVYLGMRSDEEQPASGSRDISLSNIMCEAKNNEWGPDSICPMGTCCSQYYYYGMTAWTSL